MAQPSSPDPELDLHFVNVEFDDGDSGRINLDDIRLLPADYPIVGRFSSGQLLSFFPFSLFFLPFFPFFLFFSFLFLSLALVHCGCMWKGLIIEFIPESMNMSTA